MLSQCLDQLKDEVHMVLARHAGEEGRVSSAWRVRGSFLRSSPSPPHSQFPSSPSPPHPQFPSSPSSPSLPSPLLHIVINCHSLDRVSHRRINRPFCIGITLAITSCVLSTGNCMSSPNMKCTSSDGCWRSPILAFKLFGCPK